MNSWTIRTQVIVVGLLGSISFLLLLIAAQNVSDEPSSLETITNAMMQKVHQRIEYGNALDIIATTELPGYTGWNRDRVNSNVDDCFVSKIGNQIVTVDDPLNTFQHHITNLNNVWTVSIACQNITVPDKQGHLPVPSFYARAYGPAILVGSMNNNIVSTSFTQGGKQYISRDLSFHIMDEGLYTVEVVLESIFSPNIHSLPHTPDLPYAGFLLRGFPLILNVTNSDITCHTAKTCNRTLCRSKDIESDLTTSTGRWIMLQHDIVLKDKPIVDYYEVETFRRYADGSHRLAIHTEYKPNNCFLAPLQSSAALLDTCVKDTGIYYIFIGDSVALQNYRALNLLLLNHRNRSIIIETHGTF